MGKHDRVFSYAFIVTPNPYLLLKSPQTRRTSMNHHSCSASAALDGHADGTGQNLHVVLVFWVEVECFKAWLIELPKASTSSNFTFHYDRETSTILDSFRKINTSNRPKHRTMRNILDVAWHPTKANGDALPALRLLEDYLTESPECLMYIFVGAP